MDTLRVLVDEVTEFFKPRLKDDERLEPEFVAQVIRDIRNDTIRTFSAQRMPMNLFAQRVDIRVMSDDEYVVFYDESGRSYSYGRNHTNTYKLPIPRVLAAIGRKAIQYIGGVDQIKQYHIMVSPNIGAMRYSPWSANYPAVYTNFTDSLLYYPLMGNNVVRCICIFEDPMDVPGMTWDDPYPIIPDLKNRIMYVVRNVIASHLGMPIDVINDNVPQSAIAGKPQSREQETQQQSE